MLIWAMIWLPERHITALTTRDPMPAGAAASIGVDMSFTLAPTLLRRQHGTI
jgi:hypothetical protein